MIHWPGTFTNAKVCNINIIKICELDIEVTDLT